MSESGSDYKVGPGRPPLHRRFKKGRQPPRPQLQEPAGMLADALNERVFVTIDGRHRKITTREATVTRMVNKSATADLLATNMLIDTLKDVDRKAGVASPPPEPRRLDEADNEVVRQFVERIRQQVLQEIADGKTADPRK